MLQLYTTEEDRKAGVMGVVYRDRIMNNIDNDMFLRICSAINRVFIDDIDKLKDYVKPDPKNDYVTSNLCSSGLLRIEGSDSKRSTLNLDGQYMLIEVGEQMVRIITSWVSC